MSPVDEPPLFPEIEFAERAPASSIELPPATDSGRDFHDGARARAMTPLAATGLGLVATGALLSAVGSGTLGGNFHPPTEVTGWFSAPPLRRTPGPSPSPARPWSSEGASHCTSAATPSA